MAESNASRLLASAAGSQWERIGVHKRHGIAVPLSALHTDQSCGIGEYLDLLPLIDWCKAVGFSVIQLLPLNDSGLDPSPYSGLSAYALHPIYLSLSALNIANLSSLRAATKQTRVPYSTIIMQKKELLKEAIEQQKGFFTSHAPFIQFVEENPWLRPYSLFKVLREHNERKPWWDWPKAMHTPSDDLYNQFDEELLFHLIVQYLCHQQLSQVRAYAEENGVLLMGDIPILLSPNSVDVWHYPNYFDRLQTVGAPPDQYSNEGQNWGFPLYRWDAIAKDDFTWWRNRLKSAQSYYHLYRLDHIVGFFRLWAIPLGKTGKEGRYVPKERNEWMQLGKSSLRCLLGSSTMLPIGEDLGVVPLEVRQCMRELGICGTKVMRWERYWEEDQRFIPLKEYIPESVTTISNHDCEPLLLWWQKNPQEAKAYAQQKGWTWAPTLTQDQQVELLRESHHTGSLFAINPLQEYLALFPELVHGSPEEERVNIPGTITPKNWTYRFRPAIEQIKNHNLLNQTIQTLVR